MSVQLRALQAPKARERARASLAKSGFAPSVMVQNVTSTPKRRSRCARSTVQMLVVGQSRRMTRRSHRSAPRPPSVISTHASPQSLRAAVSVGLRPSGSARTAARCAAVRGAQAHQLNDWRTCGTSTVCDLRASCAASPSAAGVGVRALRGTSTSQYRNEERR